MISPFDSLAALATGLPLRAANRLLGSAPWARDCLVPFAGEYIALSAAPLPLLLFRILPEGTLAQATPGQAACVTVTLTPAAMASFAADPGPEGRFADEVGLAGDPALAAGIRQLLRHLRWDAEDSLAHWIGDAPARRVAAAAQSFANWQRAALRRGVENVLEYAVHERHDLVQRAELQDLSSATRSLEEALQRLAERVAQLERHA